MKYQHLYMGSGKRKPEEQFVDVLMERKVSAPEGPSPIVDLLVLERAAQADKLRDASQTRCHCQDIPCVSRFL